MDTSDWRRNLTAPLRLARMAVIALLATSGAFFSWVGGGILAVELTSSYKDSAYLPLALIPLAVAAAAVASAWLLIVMLHGPQPRRLRRGFVTAVLLLPCALAVSASVLASLGRGLTAAELLRNSLPVLLTIGLTAGVAWLVRAAVRA